MRFWTIAAAALVAFESAALACSCLYTEDPAEIRKIAGDAANNAVALVEFETLQSYADSNGAGERLRVVRTLAGSAPAEFRVERGPFPSSGSCDVLYETGQRGFVILYPPESAGGALPTYKLSGLCTVQFLDNPVFREALMHHMGAETAGERG